jgi:hemolysin III
MYKGERFNIGTHLLGLNLAVAGVCWLGLRMWQAPTGTAVLVGFVMYALALLTVYFTSTLFHGSSGRGRIFWATADHCAIYLLIAGTYTAMAMLCLQGILLYALLAAVWLSAAYGVTAEVRSRRGGKPSLWRYLFVGWMAVGALVPVMHRMNNTALIALLGGAAVYSAGTFFYRNARGWAHAHGIWHLFVLGGSTCHFFAIMALLGKVA